MTKAQIVKKLEIKKQLKIKGCIESFYTFCTVIDPVFYHDKTPHLKILCNTLQDLSEDKLLMANGLPYRNLIISIPPRHGKSRTLILFEAWLLGLDNTYKFITCSFSDDLAKDFSKFTRDAITAVNNDDNPTTIIYSDIFPETRVKYGDATKKKWALEGQHFNYLGTSSKGQITGRGANWIINDDLVKGAEMAFNEQALEDTWKWYTGTLLSRKEKGCREIICQTRWAKKDIIGTILNSEGKDEWYVINMEAYNEETDTMLCDFVLDREMYNKLKRDADPLIFQANYHNHCVDEKGAMYGKFIEYDSLPEKYEIIACVDTADEGKDYLAAIIAAKYKGQAYILDIYYTKDAMEITEIELAKRLYNNKVKEAWIESNNGGRSFARTIERLLWDTFKTRFTSVKWFWQSKNKKSRILSHASFICNNIFFPRNWRGKWPEAFAHLTTFSKEGKNVHDDLEDVLTQLAERIVVNNKLIFLDRK